MTLTLSLLFKINKYSQNTLCKSFNVSPFIQLLTFYKHCVPICRLYTQFIMNEVNENMALCPSILTPHIISRYIINEVSVKKIVLTNVTFYVIYIILPIFYSFYILITLPTSRESKSKNSPMTIYITTDQRLTCSTNIFYYIIIIADYRFVLKGGI